MSIQVLARRALGLAVLTALSSAGMAQDAADSTTEDEDATLGEIVVTAQKREEALQDVPIALTVVSEQLLRDTGVRDIKDLQIVVPGLTVTSTANESLTTARIRGIGTVGDDWNPRSES